MSTPRRTWESVASELHMPQPRSRGCCSRPEGILPTESRTAFPTGPHPTCCGAESRVSVVHRKGLPSAHTPLVHLGPQLGQSTEGAGVSSPLALLRDVLPGQERRAEQLSHTEKPIAVPAYRAPAWRFCLGRGRQNSGSFISFLRHYLHL